jgi:hypothetical protein
LASAQPYAALGSEAGVFSLYNLRTFVFNNLSRSAAERCAMSRSMTAREFGQVEFWCG